VTNDKRFLLLLNSQRELTPVLKEAGRPLTSNFLQNIKVRRYTEYRELFFVDGQRKSEMCKYFNRNEQEKI
jgi:hypothetical protein